MLTEKQIASLLAQCLELDAADVSIEATRETVEGWDSIVHLSLLGLLEDCSPGVLDRYPKLAEAQSIREIFSILNPS